MAATVAKDDYVDDDVDIDDDRWLSIEYSINFF